MIPPIHNPENNAPQSHTEGFPPYRQYATDGMDFRTSIHNKLVKVHRRDLQSESQNNLLSEIPAHQAVYNVWMETQSTCGNGH